MGSWNRHFGDLMSWKHTPYTTTPHERSASNGRASCLPSGHRAPTERPPSELARQSLGSRSVVARRALVGISGVLGGLSYDSATETATKLNDVKATGTMNTEKYNQVE